jgi:hypothetical protein
MKFTPQGTTVNGNVNANQSQVINVVDCVWVTLQKNN